MLKTLEFSKMHGAGNDYIYVNTLKYNVSEPETLARLWSDRHKGIGGDGLVLIGRDAEGRFTMRIFNNDGSEAKMCGNASRCIGKYLYDKGLTHETLIPLGTLSGIKLLNLRIGADGKVCAVTVDMGTPALTCSAQLAVNGGTLTDGEVTGVSGRSYRGTFVSMGNPHFVVFVDDVTYFDVAGAGRDLEFAPAFPERCNIEFAATDSDGSIRMRVWERGSGITMACGTGACATAVAAAVTGRAGRISDIVMDGGRLRITWNETDGHVMMEGSATHVFDGTITYEE